MDDFIEIEAVEMNAEGVAPEWIELVPAGTIVRGSDQRQWFNTKPQRILNAFRDQGKPIVLDWEHGSELNASKGKRAPAAGWIEELQLRAGAIWGRVRWTRKGGEDVAERGYRYISPTYMIDKVSREILRLKSAALTHTPNLELKALNSMDEGIGTELAKVARALSLDPEKAGMASILSAIETLRNGDDTPAMNAAQNSEDYVPRRDYELAVAQLHELRERENDRFDAEIVETVNNVIAVGDPAHPPAKREMYIEMCREPGGLERFREIIVPNSANSLGKSILDGHTAPSGGRHATASERSIYETMGVDPAKVRD